jgi:hypothetical protein
LDQVEDRQHKQSRRGNCQQRSSNPIEEAGLHVERSLIAISNVCKRNATPTSGMRLLHYYGPIDRRYERYGLFFRKKITDHCGFWGGIRLINPKNGIIDSRMKITIPNSVCI